MPLTEVQEFHLHVDARAAQRAEFDRRVKEKDELYRRLKAESEAAMKAEEEQAIKNMRKAMVPHVRPVPDFSKPFVPHRW
ncbi:hypothetical protein KI387_011953 [Taxus chinensis]|uniref:TPX2 C-terminal domain-containing protein n=1 Tax=Taxus chinensis TaxID=29808 RepID=A0AA38FFN5_TAXCH|nr:hypothetical protein KI387_011953 [Taxus chinensis]